MPAPAAETRLLLYGYYGCGNFGDDLMLRAIVAGVAARVPGARFRVKCRAPVPGFGAEVEFITADRLLEPPGPAPLRALRWLRSMWAALAGVDWLVVGGGALFLDKGRRNASLLLLRLLVAMARRRGAKIAVTGAAFDLMADPLSLWLARGVFRAADRIALRDPLSHDYARYFGRPDALLSADLSFADPVVAAPPPRVPGDGAPRIGVCLVDYFAEYERDPVRRARFVAAFSALLDRHAASGVRFSYVTLQQGEGLADERMHAELGGAARFAEIVALRTVEEAQALLARLDGVVTMRFHLGVLALAGGCKVVCLHHEMKLAALGLLPGARVVALPDLLDGTADPVAELCAMPEAALADRSALARLAARNFAFLES